MQYIKNSRGVTLVELLVTLMIGSMIVGLVFLVPQLFQQQNNYNDSFNSAKNKILLITNTMIERVEKANLVTIGGTSTVTITLNGTAKDSTQRDERFKFVQKTGPENYLYDVSYTDSSGNIRSLGTVGFYLENYSNNYFIITLWAPYNQSNSAEEKFIVSQGFHTSVIN